MKKLLLIVMVAGLMTGCATKPTPQTPQQRILDKAAYYAPWKVVAFDNSNDSMAFIEPSSIKEVKPGVKTVWFASSEWYNNGSGLFDQITMYVVDCNSKEIAESKRVFSKNGVYQNPPTIINGKFEKQYPTTLGAHIITHVCRE